MWLLVISPQPSVREYLENVCRHFDYSVDFAADVAEAASRVNELLSFGLIMFDAATTRQSELNFSILRKLTPGAEIIVLSNGAVGDEEKWVRGGATAVLRAPILPSRAKYELLRRASQVAA